MRQPPASAQHDPAHLVESTAVRLALRLSPEPDALARALGAVLVAQAGISSVSYVSRPSGGHALLHLLPMTEMRAAALERRLRALPCVQHIRRRGRATVAP